jgi:hypothetical protein
MTTMCPVRQIEDLYFYYRRVGGDCLLGDELANGASVKFDTRVACQDERHLLDAAADFTGASGSHCRNGRDNPDWQTNRRPVLT